MKSSGNKTTSPVYRLSLQLFFNGMTASVLTCAAYFILASVFQSEGAQKPLMLLTCIAGFVFFLVTSYNLSAGCGSGDFNLIKYGHISENAHKGLVAAAFSQIPGALLVLLSFILPAPAVEYVRFAVIMLYYYLVFFMNFYAICVAGLLIPLAIGWIGYRNGLRRIDIWTRLVYRLPRGKKDDKRLR